MKVLKLKNTKKISKKPEARRKITMQKQTKLGSFGSMQKSLGNLENYKAFFKYLLSSDDDKLADEF